jgi:hypothetical protein
MVSVDVATRSLGADMFPKKSNGREIEVFNQESCQEIRMLVPTPPEHAGCGKSFSADHPLD